MRSATPASSSANLPADAYGPASEFNPLQAAKFFAEISKSIGERKTVSEVYREIGEFDSEEFFKTARAERLGSSQEMENKDGVHVPPKGSRGRMGLSGRV